MTGNTSGWAFSATICGTPFGATTLAVARTWSITNPNTLSKKLIDADISFNNAIVWDVHAGAGANFDFRRVAAHELGHALGLKHDNTFSALMNTTYSNAIEVPQVDDINRLRALYGGTGTNASPLPPNDVIINFGVGAGLWVYKNNNAWAMISSSGAQHVIAADMNGNGSDEVVSDFGSGFGIQVYSSATNTWTPLHPVSSTAFTAGHIDSNGKADLIIDFGPGIGLWQYANNTTWKALHPSSPTLMATGNVDGM